jgi:hypothetical protein
MAIVTKAMGEILSGLQRSNVEPDILMHGHRAIPPVA